MKKVIALAGIVMIISVASANKTDSEFQSDRIVVLPLPEFDEDDGLGFPPRDQIFIFDLDDDNEKVPLIFNADEDFWVRT